MRLVCTDCAKNKKVVVGDIISKKHRFVAQCKTCKACWDPYIHKQEEQFYKAHKLDNTKFSSLN